MNKKERVKLEFKIDFKISFCWRCSPNDDDIISSYINMYGTVLWAITGLKRDSRFYMPGLNTGVKMTKFLVWNGVRIWETGQHTPPRIPRSIRPGWKYADIINSHHEACRYPLRHRHFCHFGMKVPVNVRSLCKELIEWELCLEKGNPLPIYPQQSTFFNIVK